MSVVDDGKGFDVEQSFGKGLGLISMQERIETAGGTLTIRSSAAGGTRVLGSLPFARVERIPRAG